MRIQRLEIYGYGKWVDTTFDLKEAIHLFHGENEAGKSTLMSFIHSILFGFPTRNSTLLRYEPRESSKYGGKIIATDKRFGEIAIERIHGKVTGNVHVQLEDGTTGEDELLESILYGLDRTMFQNIFSFSLTDIENVHKLNKDQLSRYLLTIGTHGTEHYLEMADQFHADADKRYRPSGRVLELNQQLEKMKNQEEQLIALEKNNENYLNLIRQNQKEKEALSQIEKKEAHKKEDLSSLREFKKQHHLLEEMKRLTKEIEQINLPPLKEDGRYLLDEYKREWTNLQAEQQELKDKIKTLLESIEQGELLESYQENRAAIDGLENDLPELIETLNAYENSKERLADFNRQIIQLKEELGLTEHSKKPEPFTNRKKQKIRSQLVKYEEALRLEQNQQREMNALENEFNLKNQKLDQYEEMMWDAAEFREVETKLKDAQQASEASPTINKKPLLFSGLLAVLLLAAAFFTEPPFNWLLGALALLIIGIGFISSRKKSKSVPQENTYLKKEFTRQKSLKDEWQDVLTDLDATQEAFQSLLQKQEMYLNQQKDFENDWREILAKHFLPLTHPFAEAEKVMKITDEVGEKLALANRQIEENKALETSLKKKTAPILEVLGLDANVSYAKRVAEFRAYHTRLRQEINKEQETIQQLNAWNHEEKKIEQRLRLNKEKTTLLLETADTETEEEFVGLYRQKEQLDQKKSRLQFLKENTPDFDPKEELPTKEALELKEKELERVLQKISREKGEALRKQANTQLSIERLEKDGTYTEALQSFENEKTVTQRLVDEWVSDKLAAGMIQETLSRVTENRFKEIIGDAEMYFHLLTDGEYEKIVFQDDELFVEDQKGQLVDVRVLSRGTAEPLYVAIRFAYIKNTQDIMELPIIMDDPFVNFDENRRQNMYRLLTKLSKELQVIYFTFDSDALNYFSKTQITDLETRKTYG